MSIMRIGAVHLSNVVDKQDGRDRDLPHCDVAKRVMQTTPCTGKARRRRGSVNANTCAKIA
jgi:hypothetical protein